MVNSIRNRFGFTLLLCTALSCSANTPVKSQPNFKGGPLPLTTPTQQEKNIPGGEGFQQVLSIAYAPSRPDLVYLGSDTSQVWKSIDGGRSWSPQNGGYHSTGSRSLFVHPGNENIVFSAGTLGAKFEKVKHRQPVQGIYLSTDGGIRWQLMHQTTFYKQDSLGTLFAIDTTTLDDEHFTVYAGSFSDGLLVSRDSGKSWQSTSLNAGEILEIVELPGSPGSLLVASKQGLFSFDGKIQRRVGEGLPDWPRSIAISAVQPKIVYAALGESGVYKSADGGRTFDRLADSVPLLGSINDIEVSSTDADVVLFTKSGKRVGPYYSNNGGARWSAANSINEKGLTDGGGFFFPSPIAMHPTDANIALTSSNSRARVLRSEDGGENWSYSSSGYLGGRLRYVIFLSAERMIFNLTDHGPWETSNGGQSFEKIKVPRINGRSAAGGAMSGDTLVVAVGSWTNKQLLVSKNRGKTWSETGLLGKFDLVKTHALRKQTIYAGQFRSDDTGQTWKKLDHVIAAIDPTDNDRLYALQGTKAQTQLISSVDRGESWAPSGPALKLKVKDINRLEVDPFSPSRIYAATSNGVRIFDDGKWQTKRRDNGLLEDAFGGMFVETVVSHPDRPGLLFAGRRSPGKGMGNGLFYSASHGESWEQVPVAGLSNTNIWSVSVNPYNGTVLTGTSHGVYRLELDKPASH